MKINYWKTAAISLVVVLFWIAYSGHLVAAQSSQTGRITKLTGTELMDGPVSIPGEIKGFSCVAEVDGDLDKGDGRISSDVKCYILSK